MGTATNVFSMEDIDYLLSLHEQSRHTKKDDPSIFKQAPASQRIFKKFSREVNAALPKLEATRPLRWSKYAITFSSADQLKCTATAGVLPMLCS